MDGEEEVQPDEMGDSGHTNGGGDDQQMVDGGSDSGSQQQHPHHPHHLHHPPGMLGAVHDDDNSIAMPATEMPEFNENSNSLAMEC